MSNDNHAEEDDAPSGLGATDPLYVLVGEFAANPCHVEGALKEERLQEILEQLWNGAAKRNKDWVSAWQAMVLPVDLQTVALQHFLNLAFSKPDPIEKSALIMAELVKNHKVKMKSAEETLSACACNLDSICEQNENAWEIYARYCLHVFPKPSGSGWGWSRIGWSWATWWQYVEKCIQSVDPERAWEIIKLILRLIQEKEEAPLGQVAQWTEGGRLTKVIQRLAEFGEMDEDAVVQTLAEDEIDLSTA